MKLFNRITEKFNNEEPPIEDLIQKWDSDFSNSYHVNKVLNLEIKN